MSWCDAALSHPQPPRALLSSRQHAILKSSGGRKRLFTYYSRTVLYGMFPTYSSAVSTADKYTYPSRYTVVCVWFLVPQSRGWADGLTEKPAPCWASVAAGFSWCRCRYWCWNFCRRRLVDLEAAFMLLYLGMVMLHFK